MHRHLTSQVYVLCGETAWAQAGARVYGRAVRAVYLCHMSAILGCDSERAYSCSAASDSGGRRVCITEGALPVAGKITARAPLILRQPASPSTSESSDSLSFIPSGIRAYDHTLHGACEFTVFWEGNTLTFQANEISIWSLEIKYYSYKWYKNIWPIPVAARCKV
jgi:hypothetical protein